jgi:chromate transporter
MVDVLAVARSLPGSVAVNTSILAGYRIGGAWGGIFAGFGSVLPSFLVISVVTLFYTSLMQNEYFTGALRGIRGAVIALLVATVFRLRKQSVQDLWGVLLFCLALCILVFFRSVNVIFVIIGGLLLGIAIYYWRKPSPCREDEGEEGDDV